MRRAGLPLLLASIVPFIAVANGAAVSWDQKLLSLVPPGVELIAGISSTTAPANSGIVFLSTAPSRLDYDDFFALIGVDPARHISHILLTDRPGTEGQHGLLAGGRFDQARIYKSVTDGGAQLVNYRGISVVRIEPFARESASFHEVRWLAILDSKLLLFGAFDILHQELDRYLAGSSPDPLLAKKIARLRNTDSTWSLLAAQRQCAVFRNTLVSLDPKLATLPGEGTFQFGIRYGDVVEVEYEFTTSAELAYSDASTLDPAIAGLKTPSSAASEAALGVGEHRVQGIIKIPAQRYAAWYAELSSQSRARNAVAPEPVAAR